VFVDLAPVPDMGTSANLAFPLNFIYPTNSRILLTTLRDGANFDVEQQHFLEDDLTWRPEINVEAPK